MTNDNNINKTNSDAVLNHMASQLKVNQTPFQKSLKDKVKKLSQIYYDLILINKIRDGYDLFIQQSSNTLAFCRDYCFDIKDNNDLNECATNCVKKDIEHMNILVKNSNNYMKKYFNNKILLNFKESEKANNNNNNNNNNL